MIFTCVIVKHDHLKVILTFSASSVTVVIYVVNVSSMLSIKNQMILN